MSQRHVPAMQREQHTACVQAHMQLTGFQQVMLRPALEENIPHVEARVGHRFCR